MSPSRPPHAPPRQPQPPRSLTTTRTHRTAAAVAAFVAAVVLLGAATAACVGASDPLAPPDIVYGEDVCDRCGMIISDERFACATLVEVDGRTEPRRFDDIGDMFAYHRDNLDLGAVRRWYVHDHDTAAWLDATTAHFVQDADIRSPMGSGIAAFAAADRAAAFAAEVGAAVVAFDDLNVAPKASPNTSPDAPRDAPRDASRDASPAALTTSVAPSTLNR